MCINVVMDLIGKGNGLNTYCTCTRPIALLTEAQLWSEKWVPTQQVNDALLGLDTKGEENGKDIIPSPYPTRGLEERVL